KHRIKHDEEVQPEEQRALSQSRQAVYQEAARLSREFADAGEYLLAIGLELMTERHPERKLVLKCFVTELLLGPRHDHLGQSYGFAYERPDQEHQRHDYREEHDQYRKDGGGRTIGDTNSKPVKEGIKQSAEDRREEHR